uniref:Uncharacterized protein n=1 Tax=Oryza sativa subsp. japonica TaxID=39947 RepID=Q5VNE5_ORYSJ|nr:hypothetical protein [Oryza sativa Japonica Group]
MGSTSGIDDFTLPLGQAYCFSSLNFITDSFVLSHEVASNHSGEIAKTSLSSPSSAQDVPTKVGVMLQPLGSCSSTEIADYLNSSEDNFYAITDIVDFGDFNDTIMFLTP